MIRDELPSLMEMIPDVEGPVFEWNRQLWLQTTWDDRRWMDEGDLVRIGIRLYELLELAKVPGVPGMCYWIRRFSAVLTDEQLAALSSGEELAGP